MEGDQPTMVVVDKGYMVGDQTRAQTGGIQFWQWQFAARSHGKPGRGLPRLGKDFVCRGFGSTSTGGGKQRVHPCIIEKGGGKRAARDGLQRRARRSRASNRGAPERRDAQTIRDSCAQGADSGEELPKKAGRRTAHPTEDLMPCTSQTNKGTAPDVRLSLLTATRTSTITTEKFRALVEMTEKSWQARCFWSSAT